jgi:hypothetical protein
VNLYGTYLKFRVTQTLEAHPGALSIKQIAALIHTYEVEFQQRNLERRVRRALQQMSDMLEVVEERQQRNLILTRYKFKTDAKRPEFS